ncbi:hypothetical protein EV213_104152 [Aureibacillus halotolerans]|uniref:Uncharacterized protein n=2 Tax=Aureibacillus halotolerans TaxID=1508390 RepID=A0A4R6UDI0_9BACI|nr:hypothetical protein EV213_104152 [Aureibacillus halotolerans]
MCIKNKQVVDGRVSPCHYKESVLLVHLKLYRGAKMEQYLYHYYEYERGPFKTLSSLKIDEARSIHEKLREAGDVFASQRADDYLVIRRELESKARDLFIQQGGEPQSKYPHYMTLGACSWLKSWYREGSEIRIRCDAFDPLRISFTYGDLFPTMRYQDGKPYRGKVYTKPEIFELIKRFGYPQVWNRDGKLGPERYIEVQIWDEEAIEKYK